MLVVGESQTGKTSIIQQFLDYDPDPAPPGKKKPAASMSNSDFSLKIIRIKGEKVRLQLWD